MPAFRVLFASFPYSNPNNIHLQSWMTDTIIKCREDKRIGPNNVGTWHLSDTPITMSRNRAALVAQQNNFDYLVMVDDDMWPDLPYEGAKPFWDSTFDFMTNHAGPCAVAAPYCGPPPHENCYVFRWNTKESNHPNADFQIEAFSRAECEAKRGMELVAAFPTGICVIDVRAFAALDKCKLPHAEILERYKAGTITQDAALRQLKMQAGHFYYEWTNEKQIEKSSTEDVTFSRDLHYAGVPIYCNWDAWAGHIKPKVVGRPGNLPANVVPEWMRGRAMELVRADTGSPISQQSLRVGGTPLPPVNRIATYGHVRAEATDGQEPVHAGRS